MEEQLRKRVPDGATQHKTTAGPHSPVVEIDARKLVVISGQVAVNLEGEVVGRTIEEQTRSTLGNCRRLLSSAGASLADVFKVNVYLSDISEWARFNAIYEEFIPPPLPALTAAQVILFPNFRVEIEMWAVKPD